MAAGHAQERTRLGVEAENMGRAATDPGIVAMARAIEEAGADSVSVSDHLVSFAPDGAAGVADATGPAAR